MDKQMGSLFLSTEKRQKIKNHTKIETDPERAKDQKRSIS
jgi:hypothetical protein